MLGKLNETIEKILYKITIKYFPITLVILLLAIGLFIGLVIYGETIN